MGPPNGVVQIFSRSSPTGVIWRARWNLLERSLHECVREGSHAWRATNLSGKLGEGGMGAVWRRGVAGWVAGWVTGTLESGLGVTLISQISRA